MKPGEVVYCGEPLTLVFPKMDRTQHEIDRIRDCVTAFEALPDWPAQMRVLRYLTSLYGSRPSETQEPPHD